MEVVKQTPWFIWLYVPFGFKPSDGRHTCKPDTLAAAELICTAFPRNILSAPAQPLEDTAADSTHVGGR